MWGRAVQCHSLCCGAVPDSLAAPSTQGDVQGLSSGSITSLRRRGKFGRWGAGLRGCDLVGEEVTAPAGGPVVEDSVSCWHQESVLCPCSTEEGLSASAESFLSTPVLPAGLEVSLGDRLGGTGGPHPTWAFMYATPCVLS